MSTNPSVDTPPKETDTPIVNIVNSVHPPYMYLNFSLLPEIVTSGQVEKAITNARKGGACHSATKGPSISSSTMHARRGPSLESTFPAKLHKILSDPNLSDVIAWASHGRCWRVLDPKAFSERILSRTSIYFNQTKYSSFIRQVNGWGFKRIKSGPDQNACYHELFLRGMPHIVKFMKRRSATNKDSGQKHKSHPDPDFIAINKMYPLPPLRHSCDRKQKAQPAIRESYNSLKALRPYQPSELYQDPDHFNDPGSHHCEHRTLSFGGHNLQQHPKEQSPWIRMENHEQDKNAQTNASSSARALADWSPPRMHPSSARRTRTEPSLQVHHQSSEESEPNMDNVIDLLPLDQEPSLAKFSSSSQQQQDRKVSLDTRSFDPQILGDEQMATLLSFFFN